MPFDTRPLQQDPTPAEASALRARLKAGEFGWSMSSPVQGFVVIAALAVMVGFGGLFWQMFAGVARSSDLFRSFGMFGYVFIGVCVVIVVSIVMAGVRAFRGRADWQKLALFADANGLRFRRRSETPRYPGLLFGVGDDRVALDHVWSPTGRFADAGRYVYETGSSDSRHTHQWSFVAYRLPRPLPHLVLDSVDASGAGARSLPVALAASQHLPLGGEFDSRFRLYAPQGYGRDVYYLFPPDLLAHLVDAPTTFDLEIVDDWLFLYSPRALDFTDPALWASIDRIGDTVVGRLGRIAEGYADEHTASAPKGLADIPVGPRPAADAQPWAGASGSSIAPAGRRLRQSWTRYVGWIIVAAVIVAASFALQWFIASLG